MCEQRQKYQRRRKVEGEAKVDNVEMDGWIFGTAPADE
jgi:hypothetical protein